VEQPADLAIGGKVTFRCSCVSSSRVKKQDCGRSCARAEMTRPPCARNSDHKISLVSLPETKIFHYGISIQNIQDCVGTDFTADAQADRARALGVHGRRGGGGRRQPPAATSFSRTTLVVVSALLFCIENVLCMFCVEHLDNHEGNIKGRAQN
jgi:hypothetical protein